MDRHARLVVWTVVEVVMLVMVVVEVVLVMVVLGGGSWSGVSICAGTAWWQLGQG